MGKNKKNKLSVSDISMICSMMNLDRTQMRKYAKKMCKYTPTLRKTFELIEKDDKAFLSLMIGYHVAEIGKKAKKAKKLKAAKADDYWQENTESDPADDFDPLYIPEGMIGFTPDNKQPIDDAAEDNAAPNENPQDMSVNTESEDDDSNFTQRIKPDDIIGFATVSSSYDAGANTKIASCSVYSGKVMANAKAQISRNGRVVHEGVITKIKRYKDEVDEVNNGFVCGVIIENYNDIMHGDIITCFRSEDIKPDDSHNEDVNDNKHTVPKLVKGDNFTVLVTDVDPKNGTLTYLNLSSYRYATQSRIRSFLSDIGRLEEEDHVQLAKDFGIDDERIHNDVPFSSVNIPTAKQISTLKNMYKFMNINDDNLKEYLFNTPVLVDDGTADGNRTSRTSMMMNGDLIKRNSNWNTLIIPSVTIEFM